MYTFKKNMFWLYISLHIYNINYMNIDVNIFNIYFMCVYLNIYMIHLHSTLHTHMWPWSTKSVSSRWGTFVAIWVKLLIFLLFQKSLVYNVKIMFHEDILKTSFLISNMHC